MSTINISPKDVMKLRDRTGLGMGDCKNALVEAKGDMDAAEKLIREKMKGKMDARTDRAAGEGCVSIAIAGGKAAIVEIRSETDFTARNDEFRAMAADVAKMALGHNAGAVTADKAIIDRVDVVRLKTGENISFSRGEVLSGGSFASYVHHDGKLGVILQYEGGEMPADIGTGICQHIAAIVPTPSAIDSSGLDPAVVAAKRAEAVAEAQASGKPAQIAEKMAEGKLRKFFEEVTLLGQPYVRDDKMQVGQVVPKGVKLVKFVRVRLGQD
ncbi:MAG: Elongation factor Ts [Planctomycetota bacterium]|jgi:elongation factor Ts